jgi:hypothetical protein
MLLSGNVPAGVATSRYRTDALTDQQAAVTFGASYTNASYNDAQVFFDRFHNRYTPYVAPNPSPDPSPDPTPDPTPDPAPTPTPDPTPPSPPDNDPPPVSNPVAITQTTLGNFTRLTITGTSDNDSIVVSQSGNTLTIVANGTTSTVSGSFTELAIYGADGNDTITVQSSVTITSLLYGGTGNNTLKALGSAKSYIVSLGAGTDSLKGNGNNTSFWCDSSDTVTGIGSGGSVHRVDAFYQPFSSTPGTQGYISTSLNGQDLPDPTDSGTTTRLTASLFGSGPVMTDMNQGQIGDCYFLASIQSLAFAQPGMLEDMAVDLGDGTYAVQFERNGNATYVRVDGDLPVAPWGGLYYAHPQSGGAEWASIFEKAYAFFRTGASTYDSLNWGWTGSAFYDLGVTTNSFGPNNGIFATLTSALANNKAIAAISPGNVPSGIPIISSHAYSIVATSTVDGTQYITVRNPWGFDGTGNDGNTSDGLIQLTVAQFNAAFTGGSIQV